jgi:CzcA family heavy metal efflux pump
MSFLDWATRHARAIALIVAGLIVMGVVTALSLPVAIFPNLAIPRIILAAEGGDAPANSVLISVTKPIEDAVSTVPGLTLVQSQTVRGSAGFTLTFADGTDMGNALQLVNAKLSEIRSTLPPDVKTTAERLNATVMPILDYSITSKTRSLSELRNLALYTIRPRVARVPGVARVLVNGGDIKEMVITARPDKLAAYQIPLSQIEDAVTKSNSVTAVGGYDYRYQHDLVIVSGLLTTPESVGKLVVAVKNRIPVMLSDVATVKEEIQRKTVLATGQGREAVLLNIVRQPEGNTIEVARDVTAELNSLKSTLPSDVTIVPFYDQSQIVRESAISVVEAIAVGGFLALIVISCFLRNLRSAIVSLSLLPITLLTSFVALRLMGMSLNIMTLGALAVALGLVIDDSIVVVEHIWHNLELGQPRAEAVRNGFKEISPAMFASSLATMVVFLPLIFLPGVSGQFFSPLAETMIATLAISLALSISVIPLLAIALFPLSHKLPAGKDPAGFTGRLYGRVMRGLLRAKYGTVLLLLPLAAAGFFLFQKLETGFMPEFDEGAFVIDYKMPAGTTLTETDRVMKQVENILADTEGVQTWSRLTGAQSGSGLEITSQNQGDLLVRLTTGKRDSADDIIDDVRKKILTQVPNIDVDIKQILGDLIGDLAGAPSPLEVKIFGPDITQIKELAESIGKQVASVPHVVDMEDGITDSGPEATLVVDPIRSSLLGLNTDSISSGATGALDGDEVGSIRRGELLEPIRVRYPYKRESTEDQLAKLNIVNSTGQPVPLDAISDISIKEGSPELDRENQRLMDSVTARFEGVDLGTGIAAVKAKLANYPLPPGYTIEYGGLYKSQQESFSALRNVLLTAAALVFVVLLLAFRSFRVSITLLIAGISALTGVVLALFLTKTPLNISSYTGAIMIVGIVTENGVLLFDEYRRRSDSARPSDERLIESGISRLRPILMTTFAAILTLFPLALGLGAGAAMQKPLAIAVIGGLALSTLFTLVFAPLIYSVLHDIKYRLLPNHTDHLGGR